MDNHKLGNVEEVSLADIWLIMARRKYWVIGGIVFFLVIGIIYAIFIPPVFEATGTIRIGISPNSGPIENAKELSSTLMAQYGKHMAEGIERKLPVLKKVSVSQQILELTTEGYTPEETTSFLRHLTNDIIEKHNLLLQTNLTRIHERIQSIESHRGQLQRELNRATDMFETLKKNNSIEAILIMLELNRITTALYQIGAEISLLKQTLTAPQAVQTELVRDIIAPALPSTPNKTLIIKLSFILGLIFGLLIAYLADVISNMRSSDILKQIKQKLPMHQS
jgi:uncharacterized protein involved in exopolysaccharide biosynthesis